MPENGDLNLIRQFFFFFFFALGKCFVVNKSLKRLSSVELGVLKFAVVELVSCENFIKSESNAIILRRGLAQL